MKTVIVDYGVSNLASIKRATELCGTNVLVSNDPKDLLDATHVIIPGVGSFTDGMNNLRSLGFINVIREVALTQKIPTLGICLGMQLLADKGYEGGETEGLKLVSGEVKHLVADKKETRIPHIGWNEVYFKDQAIFKDVNPGTDFYFVHSYNFIPKKKQSVIATTPYCGEFVSAVSADNIFGFQFHPEKSQLPGFQLLRNFLSL